MARPEAGEGMRRRDFIKVIGSTVVWPLAVRAQQPAKPVIGYLHGQSPDQLPELIAAFRQGLGEAGYAEGQNIVVEYRAAQGDTARLPVLAADLVRRKVAVIVAAGGTAVGLAAKAATSVIPIVFIAGDDPVKLGLVASLNQPGGNATGVNVFLQEMEGKRLGLIRELVPTGALIAVLLNPSNANFQIQLRDVTDAASTVGQQIRVLNASNESDIHAAFTTMSKSSVAALLVGGDPFFNTRRQQLVTLANYFAIPAIYEVREYAASGGLISYGTSLTGAYHQIGRYAGRILNGEKPTDLPVVQSTRFQLVINLKTAKALGLDIPAKLLAIADEVIE
jgi:putative ABC transport system substrate-binding protein